MGEDDLRKTPANSGAKQSAARMTRSDRLAEQLRANLKRRKAAARRHKDDVREPSMDDPSDEHGV